MSYAYKSVAKIELLINKTNNININPTGINDNKLFRITESIIFGNTS
jgi:hypothetical protein